MRQRQPRAKRLRRQALAFQPGDVDGVAVLPEQPCLGPLPQVAPDHPKAPLPVHPFHADRLLPYAAILCTGGIGGDGVTMQQSPT